MKCKTSRLTKDHSMNYWEMCKLISEKTSLSSTHEKILHIIKEESKLGEIIEKMKCRNPQNMAEHILSECRYFCGDENGDDMTVLVMGVWKTKGLQRF